jgi:hypothetical protein
MPQRTFLGLDLGRPHEFTALAAVQESGQDTQGRTFWTLPLLNRWPLGTAYPEIVTAVKWTAEKLPRPVLVVDATGVGEAIVDLFRQATLPVEGLVSVNVTAGQEAHKAAWDRWSCPRKDLAGAVQSVLQGRRLRIAKGLREAAALTRELAAFRMKPSSSAEETLDAWRQRDQDDLVLAVALAVWLGEFGPPTEMNIIQLRLDSPSAASALAPQVVFPEVRYFAPHDSFQPMPRLDGETLLGCPDFRTQQQAAYFVAALRRALSLPPPGWTVDLDKEGREAVEREVEHLVRLRRLAPNGLPTSLPAAKAP